MNIKGIIDISRKIHPKMIVWSGDSGVVIKKDASIDSGDVCNLSSISMGVHTGTHVDAPYHFINDGNDISSLDLSRFIGFVKVFSLKTNDCIKVEDVRDLPIQKEDVVFLKTKNSDIPNDGQFYKDFIYLDISAAQYLADKGIKTLGVDYFSVDKYKGGSHPVHKLLLSQNIGIIENLCLKDVQEGRYFFSCLPLKIEGADGSPARAVLLEV